VTRDACGVERRRGALRQAGRDDAAIRNDQCPPERQLARQIAQLRERAVTEHDARSQMKIE
jgi:hypothetical protein